MEEARESSRSTAAAANGLTGATAPNGRTIYGYDPNGNPLSRVLGGTTTAYSYDKADRILSAGGTNYSVNAAGNETARGSDSFSYDQANRLTSATVNGVTSTYTYDGDGKRVSKTVAGVTTTYVYDIGGGLPVLLDDGSRKYVWGAGGLADSVHKTSGVVQVYHTDGLGSVRALTDSTGSVTQTYQTDEFGVPLAGGTQGTAGQPFSFTGEQRDPEDGLVYLRARMYDPTVGRFLSRDPVLGVLASPSTLNRFIYTLDNPARLVDPNGLDPRNQVMQGGPGRCSPPWLPAVLQTLFDDTLCPRTSQKSKTERQLEYRQQITCGMSVLGIACIAAAQSTTSADNPESTADESINPKRFTPDQRALVELAKEALRQGRTGTPISQTEGETLLQWGQEYDIGKALNHTSPDQAEHFVGGKHIHVGPIDHIRTG